MLFRSWVADEFPELADRYRNTYGDSVHAGDTYRDGLHDVMARLCRRYRIRYGRYDEEEVDPALADAPVDQLSLGFGPEAPISRRAATPATTT